MRWATDEWLATLADGRCECGLEPGDAEAGCAARRDRLFARAFEQPALYWRFHRLAVDSYALQHAAYIRSAKSFAAHVGGLCIALERGNDAALHRMLVAWLNGVPDIRKPAISDHRGALTIDHVAGIDDPAVYGQAVEEWARSVWTAYQDTQDLAREWVARSRARHWRLRDSTLA